MVVVDGEHYPPVVEAALEDLGGSGRDVLAAVLVGGREKLPAGGVDAFGRVTVRAGDDSRRALDSAIREFRPELVVDLSDEPVLDYRTRFELAAVALARGVGYEGSDFRFSPPPRPRLPTKPSVAIIGTGKRTGKTAVAGFAARCLKEQGWEPVVVAMGRGGPAEPEVLRGDTVELEPKNLLELADAGKHAASDYVEDALLGRVPTVGCRRCGGGIAGGVELSNVPDGVAKANELPGDLILLEGSGSAIPPSHADAIVLVVGSSIPEEYLVGYMGPYRLLLADVAVITMSEEPFGSPSKVSAIASRIKDAFRMGLGGDEAEEIRVIRTVFRPVPTRSVDGADAFVATTAPEAAAGSITRHLEEEYGCNVVGISHSLSNREKLSEELESMKDSADLLLCEVKAAGIDVATRHALGLGLDVVYMDNVPHPVDGDDLSGALAWTADRARGRFERNSTGG